MTLQHVVPDDFPRGPCLGAVPGVQPKLLVREEDGRYYTGHTEDELLARYESCEDLACQLAAYASRKMLQFGWALDDVLRKIEKSASGKVSTGRWDFSPAEIMWVMKRTRELLLAAGNDGGNKHESR